MIILCDNYIIQEVKSISETNTPMQLMCEDKLIKLYEGRNLFKTIEDTERFVNDKIMDLDDKLNNMKNSINSDVDNDKKTIIFDRELKIHRDKKSELKDKMFKGMYVKSEQYMAICKGIYTLNHKLNNRRNKLYKSMEKSSSKISCEIELLTYTLIQLRDMKNKNAVTT